MYIRYISHYIILYSIKGQIDGVGNTYRVDAFRRESTESINTILWIGFIRDVNDIYI